jgi:hypothetical protein
MSSRSRSLFPIAIVVCANLAALVFKDLAEWLADLFVSGCATVAGRLKARAPAAEPAEAEPGPPRHHRRTRWLPRRARGPARFAAPRHARHGPHPA